MRNSVTSFLLLPIYFMASLLPVSAQNDNNVLKLEDIYKNNVYRDKSYGPIRWSRDSKGYLTFETNNDVGGCTGIAVSFVSDQKLYDNIYQERYMGLPDDNKDGYRDGSPINFAKNLKGNLLIVHGTGDDNVHYQSFEMLVNELIKNNKMFTMMSYPMRSHGISERENTSYHLRETMEKFWKANLVPGGR